MKTEEQLKKEWEAGLDQIVLCAQQLKGLEATPNHPVLGTAKQSLVLARMNFTKKWGPGGDRDKEDK